MNVTFTEDTEHQSSLLRCMDKLKSAQVEVGLPEGASGRSKFLLALHERGAPIMRIPPRPIVGPALAQASVQEQMATAMLTACEAAAEGNEGGVDAGLEAVGQAGLQGIHDYIDAGISPPNAPVTVSGGWIYNRVAKVGVHVSGKGINKPMYATGELYGSFAYEVKT